MFRKEVSHVWAQQPTGSSGGRPFDEDVTIKFTCVTVVFKPMGKQKLGQEARC